MVCKFVSPFLAGLYFERRVFILRCQEFGRPPGKLVPVHRGAQSKVRKWEKL